MSAREIATTAPLPTNLDTPQLRTLIAECRNWTHLNGTTFALLDAGRRPDEHAPPTRLSLRLSNALATALSGVVTVSAVADQLAPVGAACEATPLSQATFFDRAATARAQEWITRLGESGGAEMLSLVRSYLQFRGRWEKVAEAHRLHRNSVRSRIATAQRLLGVDLNDPDVAAELWIAASRSGISGAG